jgi:hypothetical protein
MSVTLDFYNMCTLRMSEGFPKNVESLRRKRDTLLALARTAELRTAGVVDKPTIPLYNNMCFSILIFKFKWVPFHCGMTCSQVANQEDL